MHLAIVLVGVRGGPEQPLDRQLDLRGGIARCEQPAAQPVRELLRTCGEVLCDVVENLSAVLRGSARPSTRCMRGLDRVADVLAVAMRDLADHGPVGTLHVEAVPLIRTHL